MSKAKHASSTSKSRSRSPSKPSAKEKKRPLHQLPFVKSVSDKKSPLYPCDFWAVATTGNDCLDAELGEVLADKFLNAVGRHGPEPVMDDLYLITGSMMTKGEDFCRSVPGGF